MVAEDFNIMDLPLEAEAEGVRAERTGGHLQWVWVVLVVVEMVVPDL